jgi:hypothetical protein
MAGIAGLAGSWLRNSVAKVLLWIRFSILSKGLNLVADCEFPVSKIFSADRDAALLGTRSRQLLKTRIVTDGIPQWIET